MTEFAIMVECKTVAVCTRGTGAQAREVKVDRFTN